MNGQTDRHVMKLTVSFFFTVLQMHLKKTQISVSVWSLLLSKQRPKDFLLTSMCTVDKGEGH